MLITDAADHIGLTPQASRSEFQKGYKRAMMMFHPDKNVNKSESEQQEMKEKAQKIVAAKHCFESYWEEGFGDETGEGEIDEEDLEFDDETYSEQVDAEEYEREMADMMKEMFRSMFSGMGGGGGGGGGRGSGRGRGGKVNMSDIFAAMFGGDGGMGDDDNYYDDDSEDESCDSEDEIDEEYHYMKQQKASMREHEELERRTSMQNQFPKAPQVLSSDPKKRFQQEISKQAEEMSSGQKDLAIGEGEARTGRIGGKVYEREIRGKHLVKLCDAREILLDYEEDDITSIWAKLAVFDEEKFRVRQETKTKKRAAKGVEESKKAKELSEQNTKLEWKKEWEQRVAREKEEEERAAKARTKSKKLKAKAKMRGLLDSDDSDYGSGGEGGGGSDSDSNADISGGGDSDEDEQSLSAPRTPNHPKVSFSSGTVPDTIRGESKSTKKRRKARMKLEEEQAEKRRIAAAEKFAAPSANTIKLVNQVKQQKAEKERRERLAAQRLNAKVPGLEAQAAFEQAGKKKRSRKKKGQGGVKQGLELEEYGSEGLGHGNGPPGIPVQANPFHAPKAPPGMQVPQAQAQAQAPSIFGFVDQAEVEFVAPMENYEDPLEGIVDDLKMVQLLEMGFSNIPQVRKALYDHDNDFELALNQLFTQ